MTTSFSPRFLKSCSEKALQNTVLKKGVYILLPYLGRLPHSTRVTLQKPISKVLPFTNLKACFKIKYRLIFNER